MSRGWLIVFAKAPRPGLVKTRLSPPLSLEQCAAFYEEMLRDVLTTSLRLAREADLEPVLAFHPPDAVAELLRLAPAGFRLHHQRGADLAERMANAFAEGAAAGAREILLRGSDSPALGSTHVEESLRHLRSGADLVLTPDASGGYAMIGLCQPCHALFDLPMSTREVLEKTIDSARSQGMQSQLTRPTPDLDTASDLERFMREVGPESSDLCPRTVLSIGAFRADGVL